MAIGLKRVPAASCETARQHNSHPARLWLTDCFGPGTASLASFSGSRPGNRLPAELCLQFDVATRVFVEVEIAGANNLAHLRGINVDHWVS